MTIGEALQLGREALAAAGLPSPASDAKLLLQHIANHDPVFFIAHPEHDLSSDEAIAYNQAIKRRAAHTPIQHITGRQEFYGLEFAVSPAVLIPRPETEMLVEMAIEFLMALPAARFCEIGVGSGCISVSVLKNVKAATAVGVDISPQALEVASENARRQSVSGRLDLLNSDIFASVPEEIFDAILANPPYISAAEYASLDTEVLDFEPAIALTDGGDGLAITRRVVDASCHRLASGGVLFLEIGHGQAESVRKMFDPAQWLDVEIFDDLRGIGRTVRATRR